jgi:O-antigen/teichoic acid export membrane protein
MVSIPASIGLSILSHDIIILLCGSSYLNAVNVMQVMSIVVFLITLSGFYGSQIILPLKLDKYGILPPLIGAMCNFFGNLLLIPRFHALGAAVSSVSAEFIVTLLLIIILNKAVCSKCLFRFFFQYLFAAAIMTMGLLLLNSFNLLPVYGILLRVIIGIIMYFSVLLIINNPYAKKVFQKK